MKEINLNGIAHEIWATAQLMPGESIEDGVERILVSLNKVVEESQSSLIEASFKKRIEKDRQKNDKRMQTGELMSCPNCGIDRVPDYNFCYKCGRNYAHR